MPKRKRNSDVDTPFIHCADNGAHPARYEFVAFLFAFLFALLFAFLFFFDVAVANDCPLIRNQIFTFW